MTQGAAQTIDSIGPQDVPAVSLFLRGYLHQDFSEEHGTLLRAFQTFWTDASADDRRRFLEEWGGLLALTDRQPWQNVRLALAWLGAAWTPPNRRTWGVLLRAVVKLHLP